MDFVQALVLHSLRKRTEVQEQSQKHRNDAQLLTVTFDFNKYSREVHTKTTSIMTESQ